MTRPLVSIVLPSYNGERFLKKQLDSIFAQTFQDFEVIVADDISTDSTVEILNLTLITAIFTIALTHKTLVLSRTSARR